MPFSEFLKNIDDGRVVQVEIKGNNIKGILADGKSFEYLCTKRSKFS